MHVILTRNKLRQYVKHLDRKLERKLNRRLERKQRKYEPRKYRQIYKLKRERWQQMDNFKLQLRTPHRTFSRKLYSTIHRLFPKYVKPLPNIRISWN